MAITHAFTSAKADDADATLVRPSNWNADHDISLDVFSVYDNAGGQSFTGGTITLNLDTVKKNTNGTNYSIASDVVTIADAGTYTFSFQVSCEETGGGFDSFRAFLEVDSGGGFGEVDGTRCYGGGKDGENEYATGATTITFDVAANDDFRIRVNRVGGTGNFSTLADSSRLTITQVINS